MGLLALGLLFVALVMVHFLYITLLKYLLPVRNIKSLPGYPYDGFTAAALPEQTTNLSNTPTKSALVELRCRIRAQEVLGMRFSHRSECKLVRKTA